MSQRFTHHIIIKSGYREKLLPYISEDKPTSSDIEFDGDLFSLTNRYYNTFTQPQFHKRFHAVSTIADDLVLADRSLAVEIREEVTVTKIDPVTKGPMARCSDTFLIYIWPGFVRVELGHETDVDGKLRRLIDHHEVTDRNLLRQIAGKKAHKGNGRHQ